MFKFLLKSGLFIILYTLLQYFFYFRTTNKIEINKINVPFVERINKGMLDNSEIILLGSSIEYMMHPKDKDRRSISQRLKSLLPMYKIVGLSQAAYTIDVLNPLLQYITTKVGYDKVFLVEIGWDQFSPFDNRIFVDRTHEKLVYKDNFITSLYRPLSIFNYDFGVLSETEYKNQSIFFKDNVEGSLQYLDESKNIRERERNKYLIRYMQILKTDHPRIKALKDLIKYVNKKNIKVLFYLSPFDFNSCKNYFDDDICDTVFDNNIKLITDLFDEEELLYLDLSKSLDTKDISTLPLHPNGHLRSSGMDNVARHLARKIKINFFKNNIQHNEHN